MVILIFFQLHSILCYRKRDFLMIQDCFPIEQQNLHQPILMLLFYLLVTRQWPFAPVIALFSLQLHLVALFYLLSPEKYHLSEWLRCLILFLLLLLLLLLICLAVPNNLYSACQLETTTWRPVVDTFLDRIPL